MIKKSIKIVGLILIILSIQELSVNSQNSLNNLTKQKATEDFQYFIKLLEDTHVDPYTPIGGKLNFEIRVARYKKKIEDSRAEEVNLSLLLNEFVAYLKDNHTRINTNSNIDWSNNKQLPFYCDVAADAIYISAIKNNYGHLYGAKIISINNIGIDKLLVMSSQLQPAENISNLKANLCRQIVNLKNAQRLFSKLDSTLLFNLITEDLDTIQQEFTFLTNQELNEIEWKQKPSNLEIKRSGIFNYQFLDAKKSIMYFRLQQMFAQEVVEMINANNANHGNWIESMLRYYPELKSMENKEKAIKLIPYFSGAFRNMLEEMKDQKSEYLILDLSQNVGGYSSLATPALYMMYGDSCFSKTIEWKSVRRISKLYLDKYQITIDQYNNKFGTKFCIGDYDVSDFMGIQTDNDCKNRRNDYFKNIEKNNYGWGKYIEDLEGKAVYSPKIIVLTSAKTNSAAFHFLYWLHKLDNIIVIGTAPKQAGNTPMEGTPFQLANSGITGSISNSYQILFPMKDEKAEIFTPDFPLNWKDLQEKEMSSTLKIEIAIELINKGMINSPHNN